MNHLSNYYFDVFENDIIDPNEQYEIRSLILCLTPKEYAIKENYYIDRSPEDPKIYEAFEDMLLDYYDEENGAYEIVGCTKEELIQEMLDAGAIRWEFDATLPNNGRPEWPR